MGATRMQLILHWSINTTVSRFGPHRLLMFSRSEHAREDEDTLTPTVTVSGALLGRGKYRGDRRETI